MARVKIEQQPAYLLHRRPFSETSLLLDIFTREYGRLTLIAKGCRKKKNQANGLFLPLKPLIISWTGRGELPILTSIEQKSHVNNPDADATKCGYYLNELLIKLLHRHDSHESLFDHYQRTLIGLLDGADPAIELRLFEKYLLQEIGFGLVLDRDVETGEVIQPDLLYQYWPEKGPIVSSDQQGDGIFGSTLVALDKELFSSDKEKQQARRLTRQLIDTQLNGKQLRTRRVIREMSEFKNRLTPQTVK